MHCLKIDYRLCMPPEQLANKETLSNIYSKRTRIFWGACPHTSNYSSQQYRIYIHGRSGVVGRERMGTAFPQDKY